MSKDTARCDDAFNETECSAFAALGFTLIDATARSEGAMVVSAVPHGHWHFQFTITLPNGSQVGGFVPKTKIMPLPPSYAKPGSRCFVCRRYERQNIDRFR